MKELLKARPELVKAGQAGAWLELRFTSPRGRGTKKLLVFCSRPGPM